MQDFGYTIVNRKTSAISTNIVLRKTYLLLSLTLLFSAATAMLGVVTNAMPSGLLTIVGMFGLLFLTRSLSNSRWGLVAVFAFTGFMGYTLAPLLNLYLHNFANGGELITTALGGTGVIFLALSFYVLLTRKDFTYMGGFLFAAITIAFIASLIAIFTHAPMFQILVSAAFALISCGLILFQTSLILQGGETNYIIATIGIYVAVFNLFVSLLNILGFFAGSNRN